MKKLFLFLLLLWALPLICNSAEYGKVSMQKITEGVYLFTTSPYGVGLSGNSVAVIGKDGVLIFDTNGLPSTASTILGEVKKLTNQPVRYVVNSHWHWDHWAGNQVYLEAFPEVKIIAQEKTLKQMQEVEPKWNDEGLKSGLPGYLKDLESKLQTMKAEKKPEQEVAELQQLVDAGNDFLKQKTSLRKTFPNQTFPESLTVSLGEKKIELMHAKGITVGDTYAFLPKEKILITGDLLLSPYPYAIGGTYPAEWSEALKKMAALKPSQVIPGHGKPQDPDFIQQNIRMFETIEKEVKSAKSSGSTLDQAKELAGKKSSDFAAIIGITDPELVPEYKAYFLDVFVSRAYRELDAPLPDLPDGLK